MAVGVGTVVPRWGHFRGTGYKRREAERIQMCGRGNEKYHFPGWVRLRSRGPGRSVLDTLGPRCFWTPAADWRDPAGAEGVLTFKASRPKGSPRDGVLMKT